MKVKLGDVCEINPKRTPEDLSMNVSFIPMQSVSEQGDIDTSDIRSIKEVCKGFTAFVDGDVLMAKITPCMENGKGAIASGLHNGIGYGSTEFHVLRPNRDLVRSGWIYYFTKGKLFRINCEKNMTGSAGQKRVPKSYLQRYPIPLPSLAEQDKKITLLNRLRQIIILYKSQLQKLDELVKSRFIEMFGNPITNDRGWKSALLPEVTEFVLGSTPKSSEPRYWDGNVKWITPAELEDNSFIIYDSVRHITEEGVKVAGLRPFPAGTVIFSTRAPIGKTAIAGCEMYCNQGFKNFVCGERLNPVFLFAVLRLSKDYFIGLGTGTTFKELSKARLEKISIAIPPIALQDEFERFCRQIDKSKFAVRQALDKTQQLFDSLMQEYFG